MSLSIQYTTSLLSMDILRKINGKFWMYWLNIFGFNGMLLSLADPVQSRILMTKTVKVKRYRSIIFIENTYFRTSFQSKQILLRWFEHHCFSYCSFLFQDTKRLQFCEVTITLLRMVQLSWIDSVTEKYCSIGFILIVANAPFLYRLEWLP